MYHINREYLIRIWVKLSELCKTKKKQQLNFGKETNKIILIYAKGE